MIEMTPITMAVVRATCTSFGGRLTVLEHRVVDVVGERSGRGDGQVRHHGENRREGDAGDHAEQNLTAQVVRQCRCSSSSPARSAQNGVLADEDGGANESA